MEALPNCGCDACDEQPADLVEELESKAADLAEGRFGEEIAGWFTKSLRYRFADASGATVIRRGSLLRSHRRAVRNWQPWTAR